MRLDDLIYKTRLYTRDSNSYMFDDATIRLFINEGIDRIAQFKIFENMPYLEERADEPSYLPRQYHYMLSLFAAARCFDMDERFYEGVEKRNEFEQLLEELIGEINAGNVTIKDGDGNEVDVEENGAIYIDYIKDEYFDPETKEHEIKDEDNGGEEDADPVHPQTV